MGIDISLLLYLLVIQSPTMVQENIQATSLNRDLYQNSLHHHHRVGIAHDGRDSDDEYKGIESLRIPMLDAPMLEWSSSTL
jgi:hypothetical protein